jgi:hypothetical protein
MDLRRKLIFLLNFFYDGRKSFNWVFSSHLSWCNNPSCLFLSGWHKGTNLHQLLIEVILVKK